MLAMLLFSDGGGKRKIELKPILVLMEKKVM